MTTTCTKTPSLASQALVGILLALIALGPAAAPAAAMGPSAVGQSRPLHDHWFKIERDHFLAGQYGIDVPGSGTSGSPPPMFSIVRRAAEQYLRSRGSDASPAAVDGMLDRAWRDPDVARELVPHVVGSALIAIRDQRTPDQRAFTARFNDYFARENRASAQRVLDAWNHHARNRGTAPGLGVLSDTGPSLQEFSLPRDFNPYDVGPAGIEELGRLALTLDPSLSGHGVVGSALGRSPDLANAIAGSAALGGVAAVGVVLIFAPAVNLSVGGIAAAASVGGSVGASAAGGAVIGVAGVFAIVALMGTVAVLEILDFISTDEFVTELTSQASTLRAVDSAAMLFRGDEASAAAAMGMLSKMLVADPADAGFYGPRRTFLVDMLQAAPEWLRNNGETRMVMDDRSFERIQRDAARVPKVKYQADPSLPLAVARQRAGVAGRSMATGWEVAAAWLAQGLDVFAYGMTADGRFAVPVQTTRPNFARGVNVGATGGNQGYFYIEQVRPGEIGGPCGDGCGPNSWCHASSRRCYETCRDTETRSGNQIPRKKRYWCNYGREAPLGKIGEPCDDGDCEQGAWCNAGDNRCYESCQSTETRSGNAIPRTRTYWCDYGGEAPR